jgi:cystathionine beta-lyase/cystathionine gamma-synthase
MTKKEINSSRVPVYRDAGFELYDAETTADAFIHETNPEREPSIYIYSRYRNPTVVSAENGIMNIEGSEWSLLTQSGMSAIDTALSIFQSGKIIKPWLFFSEIYGGTISFAEEILRKRRGLDIQSFNPLNEIYKLDEFEKIIKSLNPDIVYFETISNPMLIVPDAESIISIAKKNGSKVIVDNTFATPRLWKPLSSGADIVIHSATKYLSGHGNITAGVICGNDQEILRSAINYRKYVGHMLSPEDAYMLQTQVETFPLRFRQQCLNAAMIAEVLTCSSQIRKVWYPGLSDHPSHNEAKRLFRDSGYGAMVTFDFSGKNEDDKRKKRNLFIKSVSDKIKLIPTLGDPRTILMPVESVWGAKYPEPGMIRMSAGFEETDELKQTLIEALNWEV